MTTKEQPHRKIRASRAHYYSNCQKRALYFERQPSGEDDPNTPRTANQQLGINLHAALTGTEPEVADRLQYTASIRSEKELLHKAESLSKLAITHREKLGMEILMAEKPLKWQVRTKEGFLVEFSCRIDLVARLKVGEGKTTALLEIKNTVYRPQFGMAQVAVNAGIYEAARKLDDSLPELDCAGVWWIPSDAHNEECLEIRALPIETIHALARRLIKPIMDMDVENPSVNPGAFECRRCELREDCEKSILF